MDKSIGQRLKTLRKERQFTQTDVEELTGIDRSTISTYELDKRNMSMDSLIRLSKLYKVSADYIIGNGARRYVDTTDVSEIGYKKILAIIQEYKNK